jgi:hypothetical protein
MYELALYILAFSLGIYIATTKLMQLIWWLCFKVNEPVFIKPLNKFSKVEFSHYMGERAGKCSQ